MGGSCSLVRVGALSGTSLGQPLPGIWEGLGAGQSETCLWEVGLGAAERSLLAQSRGRV